jgi:hypothetical protein
VSNTFYLQDSRTCVGSILLWWAAGGGYTTNPFLARAFSKEEAQRQHTSRASDTPWPQPYVHAHSYLAVDMQFLEREEAARAPNPGERYYVQHRTNGFNGNNVFWHIATGCSPTDALLAAKTFSRVEADALLKEQPRDVIWPRAFVRLLARPCVDLRDVDHGLARAGTGTVLVLPETAAKSETLKCGTCGRFQSLQQFWSGACPGCGADNRP